MPLTSRVTSGARRLVAETRSGTRCYHQHDALGSTIALIDSSANVTDTYRYWPYGEVSAATGSTETPFKFCGAWGYHTDKTGRCYVRRRMLNAKLSRWQSVDAVWPRQPSYCYVGNSPLSHIDPTGLYIESDPSGPCEGKPSRCCQDISGMLNDPEQLARFKLCMKFKGHSNSNIDLVIKEWKDACAASGSTRKYCVFCAQGSNGPSDVPPGCPRPCRTEPNYLNMPPSEIRGEIIWDADPPLKEPPKGSQCSVGYSFDSTCQIPKQKGCACAITLCNEANNAGEYGAPWDEHGYWKEPRSFCTVMAHELIHCVGVFHLPKPNVRDLVRSASCCFCIARYGSKEKRCSSECKTNILGGSA